MTSKLIDSFKRVTKIISNLSDENYPILNIIKKTNVLSESEFTESMCVIDSSMLEENSEQWKYNRILNNDKIVSICETIKNKRILDTVLHFFYIKQDTKEYLICFDGNHRREALILLYNKYKINIKVCCYIYNFDHESNNNIDKQIIKRFQIINQMTPIPDIYLDILDNIDSNSVLLTKRDIIEEIFTMYRTKYKSFYSTSSKCRRPNFNDTMFKDLCNSFIFESKNDLLKQLENYNSDKQKKYTKLSKNIIAKCETQNFYLFKNNFTIIIKNVIFYIFSINRYIYRSRKSRFTSY